MKIIWTLSLLASSAGVSSAFQVAVPSQVSSHRRVSPAARHNNNNKALSAYIDVSESAPRDMSAVQEWASNCGVQRADGFQLDSQDGIDWYATTNQDMAAGTPVLQIPAGMILSSAGAQQEFAQSPDVQAAVDVLNRIGAGANIPQFYLFLKVLVEYQNGEESPWFPWLNSLPRLYFNSVSMTDFCYECLPPLVFSLARGERVKLDNFMKALEKVDFLDPGLKNNIEITKWAFNVVYTRSFGDHSVIVPMADMFNHGTEVEIDMSFDDAGNYNVFTTADAAAGSPLRMSYGCPTNPSRLFAMYGFLDESSPATFCKIMNIKETPELKNLGLDFSRMLFYKDTGGVSQEVWDVLLYDYLKTDRTTQQAFYEAHMNGDAETKQSIHEYYFRDTAMALKKHVDTFLKQLDELSAKADGKDPHEHPRLPVILQHNQFVKNTFINVKANLDPMVEQATEPTFA